MTYAFEVDELEKKYILHVILCDLGATTSLNGHSFIFYLFFNMKFLSCSKNSVTLSCDNRYICLLSCTFAMQIKQEKHAM